MVGLPEARKPYSRTYSHLLSRFNAHFIVISSIGPVPVELDEVYPAGQFFGPEFLDEGTLGEIKRMMERFSHGHKYGLAVMWDGEETESFLDSIDKSHGVFDIDRARIASVLRMQFGSGAAAAVEVAPLSFVKSRSTGRIRNVLVNEAHAFSIRAGDGYISLTDEGAKLLHGVLPYPGYRVKVDPDAIPFVQKGSNVFAKFVLDCDPAIRPGDEAMIVDPDDVLVGHGRCLMNRVEMLAFKRGVAVRTRHHGSQTEE
jgi:7-cyano-7-deazaguanine tRNA-ribosyltransferase